MAGTPTPKADAIRAMREAKAERIEAAKAKSRPREKSGRKVGEPCGERGKAKAKMAKR